MTTVGDPNVRVQVDGTTFGAFYDVVGTTVQLWSADLGERSAELGDHDARGRAEQMLTAMAQEAARSDQAPFLRDDGSIVNSDERSTRR